MQRLGLSQKLMLTVGMLATVIVMIATFIIGILIYVQTEQQIKKQLTQTSQRIINDHLMGVDGSVVLQKKDEGQALVVLLRNMDMSMYMTDASGSALATYGIYRNIKNANLAMLFSKADIPTIGQFGTYVDKQIIQIGRVDTYTVPLRSGPIIVGYMQLARINYIWPVLITSFFWALLIQLPITWFVSVFVIRWGTQSTLSPLRELVKKVEELNIDELPETFSITSQMDHDVRILTETLKALIIRISSSLTRQREMAQNLSHEFKTPLARVNARLTVLRPQVSEPYKKNIDAIMQEIVSLGQQVDGLLDLATHESSHIPSHQPWRFLTLLSELTSQLSNPERVVLDVPKTFSIPIPIGHARMIWRNILENAAKYGAAGGIIHVQVRDVGKRWNVSVLNATPSLATKENVFVRQYRGIMSKSIQGHGLGMAIVRDLCKQLGLEVSYNADNPMRVCVEVNGKKI